MHFELETSMEGLDDLDEAADYNIKARGAIDSGSGDSFFVFDTFGITLEMRTIDGYSYVRLDEDGTWIKTEAEEFEDLGDLFMPLFDPYSLLEELGLDPTSATHEGSDEIRGEKAERYSIDIPARDFDQDVEGFMPLTKDTKVLFWIGEDKLPARIVVESRGDGDDFWVEAADEVTARLTIDLFDYGKPIEVQAPPESEIVDMPAFGSGTLGGGSFDDPFEGADCYGDRIDECLLPNPEVDAMAQDPTVCQGLDVRMCIVPIGYVRADVIKAIVDFHKETANIDIVVLPSIPLVEADLDRDVSQVRARRLYDKARAAYGFNDSTPSTFVAIAAIDAQSDEGGWLFGMRFSTSLFGHNHGSFSYFRMVNVTPYSGEPITDELIHLRASKYVGRLTALLHLDYPYGDDIDFLNYRDMYGFSDLDALGPNWPTEPPPCLGHREVICVFPDGKYEDPDFEDDVRRAAERVAAETRLPVEFRAPNGTHYLPSLADWGEEFASDITVTVRNRIFNPGFHIVGVTDDRLAQSSSVAPNVDSGFGDIQMSIVSGFDAGRPGTAEHRERMYRLILRGVLVARFNMELNDDPQSLMYRGITTPADLDGKTIPALPD